MTATICQTCRDRGWVVTVWDDGVAVHQEPCGCDAAAAWLDELDDDAHRRRRQAASTRTLGEAVAPGILQRGQSTRGATSGATTAGLARPRATTAQPGAGSPRLPTLTRWIRRLTVGRRRTPADRGERP